MADLFPPGGDCSLPVVPKVDFAFVDDCEVRPAPPPINTCPTPEIAFNPTLIPDIDCADVSATASISVDHCGSEPSVTVVITNEQIDDPNGGAPQCRQVFDFNFRIPIPCVEISASATANFSAATGAGGVTVTVTRLPQENCQDPCRMLFEFDFDIPDQTAGMPCATIEFDTLQIKERYSYNSASFGGNVDRTGTSFSCRYDLNLRLKIPDRRVFRGTVGEGASGCGTCPVEVHVLSQTVNAAVWLRNCCGAETLPSGTRVWLTYDPGYGWGIISREEILIVPIILTSDMLSEEAQASLYYGGVAIGSPFTVTDVMGIHPCAKDDHRGFACCSSPDGSGEWEIIAVEQIALWIEFQTTGDFTGTGPHLVDIISFNVGSDPSDPPGSTQVNVNNNLDFDSSIERKGYAMRNDSCEYDTWQVQCRVPEVTP